MQCVQLPQAPAVMPALPWLTAPSSCEQNKPFLHYRYIGSARKVSNTRWLYFGRGRHPLRRLPTAPPWSHLGSVGWISVICPSVLTASLLISHIHVEKKVISCYSLVWRSKKNADSFTEVSGLITGHDNLSKTTLGSLPLYGCNSTYYLPGKYILGPWGLWQ